VPFGFAEDGDKGKKQKAKGNKKRHRFRFAGAKIVEQQL